MNLQNSEQYRMQMAAISTAALGFWKEGDSIHPDYDTPALRDVAKLYAAYERAYAERPNAQVQARPCCPKGGKDVALEPVVGRHGEWVDCQECDGGGVDDERHDGRCEHCGGSGQVWHDGQSN